MTTEKPILFSGANPRLILDGAKWQTRRVVKPQPDESFSENFDTGVRRSYGWSWAPSLDRQPVECPSERMEQLCPYGTRGTRLWVRETFGYGWRTGSGGYSALRPTVRDRNDPDKVFYRADGWDESEGKYPWRPSTHMPRWASRITLEVTGVRVERLQSITEEDAEAEGVEGVIEGPDGEPCFTHGFAAAWDALNAKRGYPWESNPWVWVVEFRRERP